MAKLQPVQIQSYYTQALANGRRDGKGGLSPRTVLHHHRVLREALQQAVKWQLLIRNPADGVEPPRAERHEMQVLDTAGTVKLLAAAKGTRLYLPTLIAAMTGLRRGEILGLRWEDVDLKASSLAVRQTLQRTNAGFIFKQPKTQKSRRTVALSPLVIEELRRHKGEQAQQRLLIGNAYQDHGLVIAREDGTPWPPNAFTHVFTALIRKVGGPRVRFHDLRHTHATQLLVEGIHPKVVSERLGHSTIGITLDIYSHVLPGMQEDAARRVDVALRAAMGDS